LARGKRGLITGFPSKRGKRGGKDSIGALRRKRGVPETG